MPNISQSLFIKGAALIGCYINSKPFSLLRHDMQINSHWPPEVGTRLAPYAGTDCWSSESDIELFLQLIKTSRLDLQPFISHRVSWQQLPDIYKRVQSGDSSMLGVLIDWNS
jgi:L-iditol 2-dehydrogenase